MNTIDSKQASRAESSHLPVGQSFQPPRIVTATNNDLTIEIRSEDGSHTQFCQNDENSIGKILRLLTTSRLFTQPFLTLASERSVSVVPCQTIDLILVRTPTAPKVLLPSGWLDIVEVGIEAFHDETVLNPANGAAEEVPPTEAERATFYVEIHTTGNWMVELRLQTAVQATIQDQRQLLAHFFELPVIPFRLETGGVGFINPTKISRMTVYPAYEGVAETALPADLLRCIRS